MKQILIGLIVGGLFLGAPIFYFLKNSEKQEASSICQFVFNKIYLNPKEIIDWAGFCVEQTRAIDYRQPFATIVSEIQNIFSYLQVSHLNIYDSQEDRKIWQGQAVENGIESEFVDGDLFIFRVKKDSPAYKQGLLRGDIIVEIGGESPNAEAAQSFAGSFKIQRREKHFQIQLTPAEVKDDQNIMLEKITNKTVLLKIPSFRAEFFEKVAWLSMVQKLKKFEKIIVDLRGNGGGNFVAGLRFLSPFMCSPQEVGYLIRPRLQQGKDIVLADDLEDENQISVLENSFLVHLKTFENYDCLSARIAVLIDSGTASTSELVAQALKDYLGASIFGNRSSGMMLVGIWYPFQLLNQVVKISIPEAIYQTRRGHILEKNGVDPDQIFYYEHSDMMKGEDTWIHRAIESF